MSDRHMEKAREIAANISESAMSHSSMSGLTIIATALAEAEREGMRRAAEIAKAEPEFEGEPSDVVVALMNSVGPIENARAACRTTKRSIAAAILAEAGIAVTDK